VRPGKLSFQIREKLTCAESRPFLDDNAMSMEQRQIRGDDEVFGGLALLYHIKPVGTSVL